MMEGGVNPKKMARSKRASSQRSKAKHSKHPHGAGHGAAVTQEKPVAEDSLPSNWERYDDESGGDEYSAPLAEGEVRPKSKGADYRELLASDVPQLFEESAEMEGMTAMLLANGLGLWDGDSSYLEPASLSAQRHFAREASALLTVDMRLLGKSMARLNVAQRLFLEDELFPMQQTVLDDKTETIGSSIRISDSEGTAPMKGGPVQGHDHLSQDTTFAPGNTEGITNSPSSTLASDTSSRNRYGPDYRAENANIVTADVSCGSNVGKKSPSGDTGALVTNPVPTVNRNWEQHAMGTKEQTGVVNSQNPTEMKRFEATAAEAELDDLLDMLDSEVTSLSLKKGNEVNPPSGSNSQYKSFSSSIPASSWPSNTGFQESRVESKPRELYPEPVLVAGPQPEGKPPHGAKNLENNDPRIGAQVNVSLAQDDDFDSWLDSI